MFGCSPRGQQSGLTLDIHGYLNGSMFTQLSSVDWDTISQVRVRSSGGDIVSSIAIARLLKSKQVPIEIYDYCVSGCFNIVVIDEGVTIVPHTLIGVHHNATSLSAITRKAFPDIAKVYAEISSEERRWYAENGVSEALLIAPQAGLGTICVSGPDGDQPGDFREISYLSKFDLWTPPNGDKERMGLKAEGQWSQSAAEIEQHYKVRHPTGDPGKVVFDPGNREWKMQLVDQDFDRLAVDRCPPGQAGPSLATRSSDETPNAPPPSLSE